MCQWYCSFSVNDTGLNVTFPSPPQRESSVTVLEGVDVTQTNMSFFRQQLQLFATHILRCTGTLSSSWTTQKCLDFMLMSNVCGTFSWLRWVLWAQALTDVQPGPLWVSCSQFALFERRPESSYCCHQPPNSEYMFPHKLFFCHVIIYK